MKNKVLVIDERKWLRGKMTGVDGSTLLAPEWWKHKGKMCCLGFYSLACGATDAVIKNRSYPSGLMGLSSEASWLLDASGNISGACERIVELNDSKDITDAQRKRKLRKLFAEHNVTVKFMHGKKKKPARSAKKKAKK